MIQLSHFKEEIQCLKKQCHLNSSSPFLSLNSFMNSSDLLCVSGRQRLATSCYVSLHPIILHRKHLLTKLIIRTEHVRLLHVGPTLLTASLKRLYHIIGGRKIICPITRECITCHRNSAKTSTSNAWTTYNWTRHPWSYLQQNRELIMLAPFSSNLETNGIQQLCMCFCFSHCESCSPTIGLRSHYRCFHHLSQKICRPSWLPSLIWSDHGINFVGAAREIKELFQILQDSDTQEAMDS